jgi:hypothetical protein
MAHTFVKCLEWRFLQYGCIKKHVQCRKISTKRITLRPFRPNYDCLHFGAKMHFITSPMYYIYTIFVYSFFFYSNHWNSSNCGCFCLFSWLVFVLWFSRNILPIVPPTLFKKKTPVCSTVAKNGPPFGQIWSVRLEFGHKNLRTLLKNSEGTQNI